MNGPPQFQFGEVVRVVRATGDERTCLDGEVDVGPLIGERFVVNGAMPTPDCQDWTIGIWVPSLDDLLECPARTLESTGLIEVLEDCGSEAWVPLVPETARPWRDDVLLDLETRTRDEHEAEGVARRVARRLEPLSDVSAVDWRINLWADKPADISMWAKSDGDALLAFAQIIDLVPAGWDDGDDGVFITSTWTPSSNAASFLGEDLSSSDVTYRRWISPRRRSRAEITGLAGKP